MFWTSAANPLGEPVVPKALPFEERPDWPVKVQFAPVGLYAKPEPLSPEPVFVKAALGRLIVALAVWIVSVTLVNALIKLRPVEGVSKVTWYEPGTGT